MFSQCVLLFVCLPLIHGFLFPDNPANEVVTTRRGEIRGFLKDFVFDDISYRVQKFLGIPYAEPPVGNYRFRKPYPLRVFPSPLEATSYGSNCPSSYGDIKNAAEDCLYLNVVVPVSASGNTTKKQVMVWIHGGGFIAGSGDYDVDNLSAFTDVIVVTLNYRIGALGFFSTNDFEAVGNYGLWDQHFALRWIQENIESFGGDAENVAIFGESAGSSSVVFQAAYPGNRGLFKRAIAESGTNAAWAAVPHSTVYNISMVFAQDLGCPVQTHAALMNCLRGKTSDEITPIAAKYGYSGFPFSSWVPTYDGDFITMDPFELLKGNDLPLDLFCDVDLLIGWNNFDGLVYLFFWVAQFNVSSAADLTVTRDQFEQYYVPNVAKAALQEPPKNTSKAALSKEYLDRNTSSTNDLMKIVAEMATDAFLAAPTIRTVSSHLSGTGNTYVYRFSAAPWASFGPIPKSLVGPSTANHGDDLNFVFGTEKFMPSFPIDQSSLRPITDGQRNLSKTVMTMWSNFARTGNPNQPSSVKTMYDVEWRPFTKTSPEFLELSVNMTQASVKSSNNLRGLDFWNNILPGIQNSRK